MLHTRFDQSGQRPADLDEAISLYRDTLELQPPPHPLRFRCLNNLALALRTRFKQSGQQGDLNEAINTFNESLDALVSGHPSACRISANPGSALVDAHSHTHQSEYLDKAMAAFRVAVKCAAAPASERFRAAKLWACHAGPSHESALEAYRAAIELLPRLAMLGLQQALTSCSDRLARDAAACAVRLRQYDTAVELLEEGRAVFWSQALQLRTSMTDLHDVAPALEKELRRISNAPEQGSLRDMSRTLSDTPQKVMSMEREASYCYRLNNEWLAKLEEVRQLDGFQDFLHPSRLSMLQDATAYGPVVILNTSKSGSDTLIMTLSGVEHIPLPNLKLPHVNALVKMIQAAIASMGRHYQLSEDDHARIEGLLVQQMSVSESLQLLGISDGVRHVGRASNTSTQPDDFPLRVSCTVGVGGEACYLQIEF